MSATRSTPTFSRSAHHGSKTSSSERFSTRSRRGSRSCRWARGTRIISRRRRHAASRGARGAGVAHRSSRHDRRAHRRPPRLSSTPRETHGNCRRASAASRTPLIGRADDAAGRARWRSLSGARRGALASRRTPACASAGGVSAERSCRRSHSGAPFGWRAERAASDGIALARAPTRRTSLRPARRSRFCYLWESCGVAMFGIASRSMRARTRRRASVASRPIHRLRG